MVSNKLINARTELWNAEAELVPVGKARDDALIEVQMDAFIKDEKTGQYIPNPDYKIDPEAQGRLNKLQKEFKILDDIVNKKGGLILLHIH